MKEILKVHRKHSRIQKKIQEIIADIESEMREFASPSIYIQSYPNLESYFKTIKEIEYKVSQLRSSIGETIANPQPLIDFINNNLTTQIFSFLNLRFRLPQIQQLSPIPFAGNGQILDLHDEVIWKNASVCFTLKQLTSNNRIYDEINTAFEDKKDIFIERLKQFNLLIDKHINEYGSAIVSPTEKKKKWYQKWWAIFGGVTIVCGFFWFITGKSFPNLWHMMICKKPPSVLTEEDIRKIGDEIEQRFGFQFYFNTSIFAKDTLKISFERGLLALDNYNWDKAIEFFKTALNEAHDNQLVVLYNMIGLSNYFIGRIDEALANLELAASFAENLQNKEGRSASVGNISIIYRKKGELEKSLKYANEGLKLSEEINNKQYETAHFGNIGLIYQLKGELDTALYFFKKALSIDKAINNRDGEAADLGNIGIVYRLKGDLIQASMNYKKSLDIAIKVGSKDMQANQLGNIGAIYLLKGELDSAYDNFKEALKMNEEIGRKEGIAIQLLNIGIIFQKRSILDSAQKYFGHALTLTKQIGIKDIEASAYGCMGEVYMNRDSLDTALTYFQQAFDIHQKIRNKENVAKQYDNIGVIYRKKGKLDVALDYHINALNLNMEIKNEEGEIKSRVNIGLVYLSKSELNKAHEFFSMALKISKQIGWQEGIATALGNIGIVYKLMGNKTAAINNLKQSLIIYTKMGYADKIEILKNHLKGMN